MKELRAREVINAIISQNCSLLAELKGGEKLKKDISSTGKMSRWLLSHIMFPAGFLKAVEQRPELWKTRRLKVVKRWCRIFFPYRVRYQHNFPRDERGKIIVINHPSLTDPLVVLVWAMLVFPQKPVLLPVNLPWFEEVSQFVKLLEKVGIFLVPTLTPKTMRRLEDDPDLVRLKGEMRNNYLTSLLKLADAGGMGVVAQPAGRQRCLWLDQSQRESGVSRDGRRVVPTVGVLKASAKHAKLGDNIDIVTVGVALPRWWAVGIGKLNLFIPYHLNVGYTLPLSELPPKPDVGVLREMEALVPQAYWVPRQRRPC
jgi:hypothetical protein